MMSTVRYEYEQRLSLLDRTVSFQAKEAMNSAEVDHHRLRIDYSTTKRAHTPSRILKDHLPNWNNSFFQHRGFTWVSVQHLTNVRMVIVIVVHHHRNVNLLIDDIIIIIIVVVMIIHPDHVHAVVVVRVVDQDLDVMIVDVVVLAMHMIDKDEH